MITGIVFGIIFLALVLAAVGIFRVAAKQGVK